MDEVFALLRGDVSAIGIVVSVFALIVTGRLIPRPHHLEVVTSLREQLSEIRADRDLYRDLAHGATETLDRAVDLATSRSLAKPSLHRPTFQPRTQGDDDD